MKKVNVQYRFFDRTDDQGTLPSLASLITKSLDVTKGGHELRSKSGLRRMIFDDGLYMLNRCDEQDDWVFGELATFKPGEHIKVIEDAAEEKVVNLEQIDSPPGKHPLRGVSYWLVVRDHILLIQAPNISINTLKRYLNWLILTHVSDAGGSINFGAQISVNEDNAPPVNEVQIRPAPAKAQDFDNSANTSVKSRDVTFVRDAGSESVSGEATVLRVLRAIGIGEGNLEKLRERAGDDGELLLDLAIKIKRRGKVVSMPQIDAASLFSEIEEDEVTLRGKHGKQVGKMIMLAYQMGRVQERGSLLDPDDALRVLIEAFRFFVGNQFIESEIHL